MKGNSMSTQKRNNAYYGDVIHGNAVRKAKPERRRIGIVPKKEPSTRPQKNRDKARYMTLGYVLFLAGLLVISAFVLSDYIGLQSNITTSIKSIARLERELNNIRLANEENHSRITNNVDLDYIRRIAIQELGMIYPKEGQVIDFIGNKGDYVRQLNPLP
jgi:cell division protein FtsB